MYYMCYYTLLFISFYTTLLMLTCFVLHALNMKCIMSISCFFTCFILITIVYYIPLAPAVSSVYNPSSPPIRLQRPHDPPPYASSETTPMRLDPSSSSSYQDTNYHHHGVMPQTQYRDVVGQSLPESAPPPPPPTSTLQQYNNNRELQREGYQPDHHRAKLVMSLSLCLFLSLSLSLSFCLSICLLSISLSVSLSLSLCLSLPHLP